MGERTSLLSLLLLITLALPRPSSAFDELLGAASELSKDGPAGYKRPLPVAPPPADLYPHTSALLARFSTLASSCPSASLGSVIDPNSPTAPAFPYITLTAPAHYITSHLFRRRTRAVFVFGEHPREAFITPAIALALVEAVCGVRNTSAARALAARAARVLTEAELVLVPLANPSGRALAEAGSRCETRNARNVDLNRNWPHSWNGKPASDAASDAASDKPDADAASNGNNGAGSQPVSEPETRALRTIVTGLRPSVYVSVQSGFGLSLAGPGECRPAEERPTGLDAPRLNAISDRIVARHCAKCTHASLQELSGSGRCGSGADYMYYSMKVPFVYTWRVYHNPDAAPMDCIRYTFASFLLLASFLACATCGVLFLLPVSILIFYAHSVPTLSAKAADNTVIFPLAFDSLPYRSFNPITAKVLQSVTDRWSDAILTMTEAVHTWHMIQRESGSGAALQNASNAAVADMAQHMASSSVDADEEERHPGQPPRPDQRKMAPSTADGGSSRHPTPHGYQENPGKRSRVLEYFLSLFVLGTCLLCLFLLRSVVFSSRLKPYHHARRRAGRVAVARDWMKVL